MDEWSRIVIERYCETHNSKKSRRLAYMVAQSYDLSAELTDDDAIFLERCIQREKDPEMQAALEDLDDFMFRY